VVHVKGSDMQLLAGMMLVVAMKVSLRHCRVPNFILRIFRFSAFYPAPDLHKCAADALTLTSVLFHFPVFIDALLWV